jgi:hypothetical protein
MSVALLLSLALVAADGALELSDGELAGRAEAAFAEGLNLRDDASSARPHFRQAAEYYDELRRRGVGEAALYRNLGHSWLLAGDLPQAILTYRRGLRRWPADRSLRSDLTAARELVTSPSLGRAPAEARPPWWSRLGAGPLTAAAGLSYLLGCVGLTRWWMTRRGRLLMVGLTSLVVAGGLGTFAAIETLAAAEAQAHPLVVITEDGVLLRRGDGRRFPKRYETPVNRGVEARLLFERGDWLQVELSGGEVGWIARSHALVDGTDSASPPVGAP